MASTRTPAKHFSPLAIGAPEPYRALPVKLERMIHFVPPHIEKVRARVPELIRQVDIVLGNLEDAIPVDAKEAARSGFIAMAQASDFGTEFLDKILAVRVVPDRDAAIAHIRRHGSDHTEVIATRDAESAHRFERELRSAVIMVNASSRFSDGGELGLGAEIGISTTRLHAYGPMGAEALTIERYVVRGSGQVRHPTAI